jgi:hypothetical protein
MNTSSRQLVAAVSALGVPTGDPTAHNILHWVLRGGRFAALPRQAVKGIDQGTWKSLLR